MPKWKEQNQTGQGFLPLIRFEGTAAGKTQSCQTWPRQAPSLAKSLKSHCGGVVPALGTWAKTRTSYNTAAAPATSQVGSKFRVHNWSWASPANIWLHFISSVDSMHEDTEHPHLPLHLSALRILTAAPRFQLLCFYLVCPKKCSLIKQPFFWVCFWLYHI